MLDIIKNFSRSFNADRDVDVWNVTLVWLSIILLIVAGGCLAVSFIKGCGATQFGMIISCVALFIALYTARYNYLAMKFTKQAKEAADRISAATVMASLKSRYWLPEMEEAVKYLYGKQFTDEDSEDKKWYTGSPRSPEMNENSFVKIQTLGANQDSWENKHRRLVKGYFIDAWEAWSANLIDDDQLKKICDVGAFGVLFDVVEPMEKIINVGYDAKPFYELMSKCSDIYKKIVDKKF